MAVMHLEKAPAPAEITAVLPGDIKGQLKVQMAPDGLAAAVALEGESQGPNDNPGSQDREVTLFYVKIRPPGQGVAQLRIDQLDVFGTFGVVHVEPKAPFVIHAPPPGQKAGQ